MRARPRSRPTPPPPPCTPSARQARLHCASIGADQRSADPANPKVHSRRVRAVARGPQRLAQEAAGTDRRAGRRHERAPRGERAAVDAGFAVRHAHSVVSYSQQRHSYGRGRRHSCNTCTQAEGARLLAGGRQRERELCGQRALADAALAGQHQHLVAHAGQAL